MDPMLQDHDHCLNCGVAVPFEQAYCCEACYYEDQARKAKERRNEIAVGAVAVIGAVAILIAGYLLGRRRLSPKQTLSTLVEIMSL